LFWLSLLPFTTGWMGENEFKRWPTVFYGINLLSCAVAYYALQSRLVRLEGRDSMLARAIGADLKGKISPLLYLVGIATAWLSFSWIAIIFFAGTAAMWLIPDQRIERLLDESSTP